VTRYLARRLVYLLVQVLLIATAVFMLIRLVPGDPARAILGETASEEQVAVMQQRLGIDRPVLEQYAVWMGGVLRGDLGKSIINSDPIGSQIAMRIGNTFELAILSTLAALVIGIPLGVVAAVRANRVPDIVLSTLAMLGLSLPGFVVGTVLLLVFGLMLRWLPQQQYVPFADNPSQHLRLLILPVITLAASTTAVMMRMTRASMLEVVRQDYVRTARAKGLANAIVLMRHALRNALNPVVSLVGLEMAVLLGGTVIVETIFGWPGLSSLLLAGVRSRDYPTVQAVVLVIAVLTILINLAVDLVYGWLDPRIRYS
jgi:peptide/nickel transport system permease protein